MSYPKEKNRKYLSNRYIKQRHDLMVLVGGEDYSCSCGSKKDLEFDHIIKENKEFPVGKLWTKRTLPKVYEELKKCQILCYNCHKEKTNKEISGIEKRFTHGTMYGWMRKKCHCSVCIEAKTKWNNKRNLNRRKKQVLV